jgi:hypothetical protein
VRQCRLLELDVGSPQCVLVVPAGTSHEAVHEFFPFDSRHEALLYIVQFL